MQTSGARSDKELFQRVVKSFSSGSLTLDEHSWEIVKAQALQKARAVQENVARVAAGAQSLPNLAAQDKPSRISLSEQQHSPLEPSEPRYLTIVVARTLVCLYFFNMVYEDCAAWSFLQSPDMKERIRLHPDRFPAAQFPYFKVFMLLPAAAITATGARIPWVGLLLPLQILYSDGWQIAQELGQLLVGAQWSLDELVVKKLAVAGAALLLLACKSAASRRMNSYAGLLVLEEAAGAVRRRSAALLACRLLMSTLFIFAGCSQVRRIVERDLQLWRQHRWGPQDGHDSNWLLLELLLTLPFMVGYRMQAVSRALSATLALEACTSWAFFFHTYPNLHLAAHVRSHFFTNMAVAGGLLLLQGHGAGSFTLDALLSKKKAS